MFRKGVVCYFLMICMIMSLFTVSAWTAADPDEYNMPVVATIVQKTDISNLKAKAAILMDSATGNVLLEKNMHEKRPIASVTKVMSMLLIMEAIDSGKLTLEDKVPVSEHSYKMGGSQVWLKPGEVFTVDEMMKAIAIHSANDCTVAVAEKMAGSEEAFVAMMNEKAKELGMNDTHFLDCSGLTDEGHYSSAYDIAVMSRELLSKHPRITEYTSKWMDIFRPGEHQIGLTNTNKLVRFYDGANGLKTGYTSKAGHNLTATAKRNNLQLIAVVLGEPDSNTRFAEARKLLDHGFANYVITEVGKKGDEAGEVNVLRGVNLKVKGVFSDDVNLLLSKGNKAKINREVLLEQSIKAPVKEGQKLGEVIFRIEDREVGRAEVVAACDVAKASFMRLMMKMVIQWFSIGRVE